MASRAERATSFGTIAADYDRLRPSPPHSAISWLLPSRCDIAADLAAGTGLLTRVLARHAERVVAIELDPRMATVLRERSPGAGVVRGRGEQIPLRRASVDAVLISSAWHWLEPARATPELGRVIRPGGRLGMLWTTADPSAPWLRELRRDASGGSADGARSWRELEFPDTALFTSVTSESFTFTRTMTPDDFVAMLGTYSRVITAEPGERQAQLDFARTRLGEVFPGASTIEVPMRTRCWRADRA